jgi:hypothetical protein
MREHRKSRNDCTGNVILLHYRISRFEISGIPGFDRKEFMRCFVVVCGGGLGFRRSSRKVEQIVVASTSKVAHT